MSYYVNKPISGLTNHGSLFCGRKENGCLLCACRMTSLLSLLRRLFIKSELDAYFSEVTEVVKKIFFFCFSANLC